MAKLTGRPKQGRRRHKKSEQLTGLAEIEERAARMGWCATPCRFDRCRTASIPLTHETGIAIQSTSMRAALGRKGSSPYLHYDCLSRKGHLVPDREFLALAHLHRAIEQDQPLADRLFCRTAALGQSTEFQKLGQLDGSCPDENGARIAGTRFNAIR